MVKRPWDHQVFYLSNSQMCILISFKCHPNLLFQLSIILIPFRLLSFPCLFCTSAGSANPRLNPVSADREALRGGGSSANDKTFLPGIIVFRTWYFCISCQVLLNFLPVITVVLVSCSINLIYFYTSPMGSQ